MLKLTKERSSSVDETRSSINLWVLFLLLALCFLQFFWRLGDIPFYSRGESREGLVVWEMVKTGNLILPMINGDYIPFKPPLFHWIGVLAAKITGGVDEFSIRFPSAFFAALGVLLTYTAGARLWNERAGRFAAFVLATNSEWWRAGAQAQVDMTLAFFITATMLLFYYTYREGKYSRGHSIALAFLWACATLAKGPLGCLVPLLTVIAFLGLRRDFAMLKKLHLVSGAVVFVLVVGSWYGLALWQGGPAFFLRQIVEENIGTARGTWGHYQPIYYFVPVFFYNLAPWSVFLFPIAFSIFRRRQILSESGLLFPVVWFMAVFLFFSIALGKRAVYILPLYPAFALLLGGWWASCLKNDIKADWLTTSIGYLLALSTFVVIIGIGLFLFGIDVPIPRKVGTVGDLVTIITPPSPLVWISLAVGGVAGLTMVISLRRKEWQALFFGIAILATMATVIVKTVYYPAIASARTLKPFGIRLQKEIDSQAPLLFYDAFDAGTIFYSRRHIAPYFEKTNEIMPPFFVLMWEKDWEKLRNQTDLKMLAVSEGRGPVGKNRLVLVQSSRQLPVLNAKSTSEAIRQDLENPASD